MRDKETQNQQEMKPGPEDVKGREKRVYAKPSLTFFGRAVDTTHGPSIGNSESGNPFVYKL